jgi:predicted nucleotidyltransferase
VNGTGPETVPASRPQRDRGGAGRALRSTPADPTDGQAARVVDIVREVFGETAIGAYLHGSAAFGGLRATSDIDILVVTRRSSTSDEKRRLIERLLRVSGRGDPTGRSRPIELTVVVSDEVRPWRYPPPMDLQYGDWWRAEFERGELNPWASPNPDLALLLEMALQADRPLFGPPPADVLGPIPAGDIRSSMLDGIPGLLADLAWDTGNVLLTFARIWTTLETGVIRSKDAAADWAMDRLPPRDRPVLAHARAIYLGERPDEWSGLRQDVRPSVDRMTKEIRRVAKRPARGYTAEQARSDSSPRPDRAGRDRRRQIVDASCGVPTAPASPDGWRDRAG